MKIMIYVNHAYVQPNRVNAVSGHAQLPLVVCKKLSEAGHDVTLVTSKPNTGQKVLPIVGSDFEQVVTVTNATPEWPKQGFSSWKAVIQAVQIRREIRKEQYDIVHFFGANKSGLLLGLISLFSRVPTIFTAVQHRPPKNKLLRSVHRFLLGQIDCLLVTSDYLAGTFQQISLSVNRIIRPGVIKDLRDSVNWLNEHENSSRKSVLFWRNANYTNGADIAIAVYRELAPRWPEIDFVFAVRPNDILESQILALAEELPNVQVYLFPYKDGITLEGLMRSASSVLLPMRRLSLNPLMSILETMYAGIPLVTSRVECNPEMIEDGITGFLVRPNDIHGTIKAVERLLNDRELGKKVAQNGIEFARENWNYDSFIRKNIEIYQDLINKKARAQTYARKKTS